MLEIRLMLVSFLMGLNIYALNAQNDKAVINQIISQIEEIPSLENVKGHQYILDLDRTKRLLSRAPMSRNGEKEQWVSMDFYLPDGSQVELEVSEEPISALELYDKYPSNKTYKVKGDGFFGKLAISNNGLSGTIYNGEKAFFIEKLKDGNHLSYYPPAGEMQYFTCLKEDELDQPNTPRNDISIRSQSNGSIVRTYRIALATTGEYYTERGGNNTDVNANINTVLTALKTLYEKEFSITFELISTNDDYLYTDKNTDPFTSTGGEAARQFYIDSVPSGIYDIGHVLHDLEITNGYASSGSAYRNGVCVENFTLKGGGWTGAGGNYTTSFFLGTFGHEIGHQFGANHTFYGTQGNCNSGNRANGHGYEPGSGNSIMSYEGSCGAHNISPSATSHYFHTHSIEEILSHVNGNGNCHTTTNSGNSIPVVTVPSTLNLPIGTPFELSGSASDANNATLYYNWEQYDTDSSNPSDGSPNLAAFSSTAPLFRSFDPSIGGNERTFPKLSDIIGNTQTQGEILPLVGRTAHFRLTARDFNTTNGAMSCEETTVNFIGGAGPFQFTSDNGLGFPPGETTSITWDVAGTNNSPINCTNVKITFSIDGGNSFPYTLSSSTSNDGEHTITFPSVTTNTGRIKIEAIGNVFFNIYKKDIILTNSCIKEGGVILNASSVTADAGDPSLALDLDPGLLFSSYVGDLASGDPLTSLATESGNNSGNCSNYSNSGYYESVKIMVSAPGTYSFASTNSKNINLYFPDFIPSSPCSDFLELNTYFDGTYIQTTNSFSYNNFETNKVYEIVFAAFFSGQFGNFTITNPSGPGDVYVLSDFPVPGNAYNYVMVKDGIIAGIQESADLTDDNKYTSGSYSVYGLGYFGAIDFQSYVGNSFSSFQSDMGDNTICAELSSNSVSVMINGCTPSSKTVTTLGDSNTPGTLRYCIANSCAGDVISFQPFLINGTIVITSPITINENLTISGLGMNDLSLSGNNNNCLFNVLSGVNLEIKNLKLKDGFETVNGGAFTNSGTVTLENVMLDNNKEGALDKAFTNFGNILIEGTGIEIK